MKRYDKYKQTGTPWIGEIPSHWEVKRGKFVSAILAGFAFNSNHFTTDEGYMPLIRIRDINKTSTEMNFNGEYPKEYIIKKGDILIGMDGDFNVAKWNGPEALLNQRVCKIEDGKEVLADYAYYLLPHPLKLINDVCYATTVKHLSTYDVMGEFFPVPPIEEQKSIISYLDKKCGSIDTVISTQERRIALLEELKQSVITEAVTHGINPDAKLRPSGIDWIGNIPEHWEVMPLKYVLKVPLMYGANESADSDDESNPRYIRITDIDDDGKLKVDTICRLSRQKAESYLLKKNDILFARSGATVGKTYLHINDEYACFAGYLIKAECNEKIVNPFFVYNYTKSKNYSNWKDSINIQATIQNIGADKYSVLSIPVPPLREQEEIVEYIDRKIKPIDASIAKAKREIELLKELKQSVITEAVTGKIKIF